MFAGVVIDVDGLTLAEVVHKLGAGRCKAGQPVNHSVGAELLLSLGQKITRGNLPSVSFAHSRHLASGPSHDSDSFFFSRPPGTPWLRVHYEQPAPSPDQIERLQSALVLGSDADWQKQSLVQEVMLPD